MTETTPKRRWFRFSLRTLLVVVLLLSLPLGWFAVKLRQAEKQRKAVEAIREARGRVVYDYELKDDEFYVRPEPPGPAWLRRLVGDDFFADVVHILTTDWPDPPRQSGDVFLGHVNGLRHLESLNLFVTPVTDAGMENLEGLTTLETLTLYGTQITDGGVGNIKGLSKLESLSFCDTKVTDGGLENLVGLTDLAWLRLPNSQVTDAGLQHLRGLTKLKHLDVDGTSVTEQGLNELRKALPNCEIHWTNPNRN